MGLCLKNECAAMSEHQNHSPIDEGVVKFDASDFEKTGPLPSHAIEKMEAVRRALFEKALIGEYPDIQIGYGNLSQRNPNENGFLISGTQTGHLPHLSGQHYTAVTAFDIGKNRVSVKGPIQASSESLTHAALYASHDNIRVVIHVHSLCIWQGMLKEGLPHTAKDIPYGTPAMANAVKAIVQNNSHGVLAMAGHEEGVITFGENWSQALKLCLDLFDRYTLANNE